MAKYHFSDKGLLLDPEGKVPVVAAVVQNCSIEDMDALLNSSKIGVVAKGILTKAKAKKKKLEADKQEPDAEEDEEDEEEPVMASEGNDGSPVVEEEPAATPKPKPKPTSQPKFTPKPAGRSKAKS